MADININKFPGIAPRIRSAQPGSSTFADKAENVDLYGGTLRPLKEQSFVAAGHSQEIFFFGCQKPRH